MKHSMDSKNIHIKAGIFVVSTSRYTMLKKGDEIEDVSGELAKHILENNGIKVKFKKIIGDGLYHIKESFKNVLKDDIGLVIYIGGTGISKTDMTTDALEKLIEKKLPGFGELFRIMTFKEAGTISIMSRALLGVKDGKIIVALPGSSKAVKLALEKVLLPEIKHIFKLITFDRH